MRNHHIYQRKSGQTKEMIIRELKFATWAWDETNGELILQSNKEKIVLNRTYAFSLARFLIRVFFRMSMKSRKVKEVMKHES